MAGVNTTQVNETGSQTFRAYGSLSGTYTAANFTVTLAFSPVYIKVVSLTSRIQGEWFLVNGNATQLLTVAAGTRTLADAGISVTGNAFTVTVATASLDVSNDTVFWEAYA